MDDTTDLRDTAILRDEAMAGRDEVGDLLIDWSVVCHVGRVREANEDAALALPGRYLVADGMGGHDSGELASEAALQSLADAPVSESLDATQARIGELLVQAQDKIGEFGTETGRRAGTTATGVVLADDDGTPTWVAFNIGDSRTYLYSRGKLTQVTIDHSQVQELVDAGFLTPAQARVDPRRNVITRALGAGMTEPIADYFAFLAEPGDVILICSDGLDGELDNDEISVILQASADNEVAATALVAAALECGAHDNVTVAVVSLATDGDADDAVDSNADADVDGSEHDPQAGSATASE